MYRGAPEMRLGAFLARLRCAPEMRPRAHPVCWPGPPLITRNSIAAAVSLAARRSVDRTADPDADLVARCRRGDRGAFDVLLARHRGWVLNLAYQMLGAADEAQDAAQEAFVRAFTHLKQFRGEATFGTWLRQIAVNECLNRAARRRERPAAIASLEASARLEPAEQDAAAQALAVRAAVQSLTPPLRAALILREMHGASYQDIARILGIPVGTVRSRLAAARERLRQLLSEEE
jgi:RNA polymerase sigma-70 factor (ECF subfamily)